MSSKKVRASHMKICHSSLKNVEMSDQIASDEPTVDDLDAVVEHDREIGNSQYANVSKKPNRRLCFPMAPLACAALTKKKLSLPSAQ